MSWMFTRGTLKAHYVEDGKAICGSGKDFEPVALKVSADGVIDEGLLERFKCRKCVHKLELMQPKEPWINPDTFSREYEREAIHSRGIE